MKAGRKAKFSRGDAVIHRGEIKAVQGVSRKHTQNGAGEALYYNVKSINQAVNAVRSDKLRTAVGAW